MQICLCVRLHFVVLTQCGNLLLVDDLSLSKVPSSNGQLFRVSTVSSHGSGSNLPALSPEEAPRGSALFSRGVRLINRPVLQGISKLVVGSDKSSKYASTDQFCLSISQLPLTITCLDKAKTLSRLAAPVAQRRYVESGTTQLSEMCCFWCTRRKSYFWIRRFNRP